MYCISTDFPEKGKFLNKNYKDVTELNITTSNYKVSQFPNHHFG